MFSTKRGILLSVQGWIFLVVVAILGYFTYFHGYADPNAPYWDETYHIVAAQKYLNGVFFMEPHPPLGKLLIAAGEKLMKKNSDEINKLFIDNETIKTNNPELKLGGYRFFPALLGFLTSLLLFFVFLVITNDELSAVLLSFLFLFDTAIPLVTKSALLESPLIFFEALAILSFLLLLKSKDISPKFILLSILFGTSLAGAFMTKLTGLFLAPLFIFLFLKFFKKVTITLTWLAVSCTSFLIVFLSVWHAHFVLAREVNPKLMSGGFYTASEIYKAALMKAGPLPLGLYPDMILDNHAYTFNYNSGVPKLDLCKPSEAGSPWYYWPMGARPIAFRSEKIDGQTGRYFIFMPNPAVWWLGAASILTALSYYICSHLFKVKLKERFLIGTFLALYFGYLFGISLLNRVMYLTHYLPPLIISLVLAALVFNELNKFGHFRIRMAGKQTVAMLMALLVFISYQYFRPLTSLDPMTNSQVQRRAFLSFWELKCYGCQTERPFFIPRECGEKVKSTISLSAPRYGKASSQPAYVTLRQGRQSTFNSRPATISLSSSARTDRIY